MLETIGLPAPPRIAGILAIAAAARARADGCAEMGLSRSKRRSETRHGRAVRAFYNAIAAEMLPALCGGAWCVRPIYGLMPDFGDDVICESGEWLVRRTLPRGIDPTWNDSAFTADATELLDENGRPTESLARLQRSAGRLGFSAALHPGWSPTRPGRNALLLLTAKIDAGAAEQLGFICAAAGCVS